MSAVLAPATPLIGGTTPQLRVISLGWGVQSWTLAAMSALGELPPVDAAIHGDTTHERSATYAFAREWTPWLEAHGVPVLTMYGTNTEPVIARNTTEVCIPAFTVQPTGKQGQLRRQCTNRWKIQPLRRAVSTMLRERGLPKRPGVVECWLGISQDEWTRVRSSDVQYVQNEFPLIDRRMTRDDCKAWLQAHGLPVPVKSSCVFCPFHDAAAWRALRATGGADWDHAMHVDLQIRDKRPPYPLFVHRARVPLAEAVQSMQDTPGEDGTCDGGYCFI